MAREGRNGAAFSCHPSTARAVVGVNVREATTVGRGGGGWRKGAREAAFKANPGIEGPRSHGGSGNAGGGCENAGLGTGVTRGTRASPLPGWRSESSDILGDTEAPSGCLSAVKWTGDPRDTAR